MTPSPPSRQVLAGILLIIAAGFLFTVMDADGEISDPEPAAGGGRLGPLSLPRPHPPLPPPAQPRLRDPAQQPAGVAALALGLPAALDGAVLAGAEVHPARRGDRRRLRGPADADRPLGSLSRGEGRAAALGGGGDRLRRRPRHHPARPGHGPARRLDPARLGRRLRRLCALHPDPQPNAIIGPRP